MLVRQRVVGQAWIELAGCRPRSRGQRRARACLIASLQAAAGLGYQSAALTVDSENSHGAGGLYESVGFELTRQIAVYGRLVGR